MYKRAHFRYTRPSLIGKIIRSIYRLRKAQLVQDRLRDVIAFDRAECGDPLFAAKRDALKNTERL